MKGQLQQYGAVLFCLLASMPLAAQVADFPRTAGGKPDLSGIWQTLNEANWNLEGHPASQGAVESLGAVGAVPPGAGVVQGGGIPYLPAALEQRHRNFETRRTEDTEAKCFMPGVPRATYLGQPFQIFQTDTDFLFTYQFAGAVRTVYMEDHQYAMVDSWMGWSNGHWEGDTLVIEVSGLNPNWLDRSGNFASASLRVTERYTPLTPNHLLYEATLEDPEVFERPWTISMPLYRRMEADARLYEFKCVEFAEELMYGHLRKSSANQQSGEADE